MKQESAGRCRVSGFLSSASAVDEAIYRLGLMGTPRDLVEVAVSKAAADRYYGGKVRRERTQMARGAAVGALVGLLAGIAVSLVVVILPGRELSRMMYVTQLLGPNAGSALGALLGALVGAGLRPVSRFAVQRALERDEILVVVRHCIPELAPEVRGVLEGCGGSDVRVET